MTARSKAIRAEISKFERRGWLRLGQHIYWREHETGDLGGMPSREVALRLSAFIEGTTEEIEAVLLNMRDDAAAEWQIAFKGLRLKNEVVA